MDFLDSKYKYKARFYSWANVIVPEDKDVFFAKASLNQLKSLLPVGVVPSDSPDKLYFAANGAVAGLCNANDDSVDNATALEIFPRSQNAYINLDHKKEDVVGVLLYPGISEFGTSRIITPDEAANLDIFNLSLVGVVWRPIKGELIEALVEASDMTSPNFGRISLSWEIYFNDYDIAIGSKVVKEARIVSDESEKEHYAKYLKCNGGKGEYQGEKIYRVIKNTNGPENPNVIITGYSWVTNPAAEVKGFVIVDTPNVSPESTIAQTEPEINTTANTFSDNNQEKNENNDEKISLSQNQPVIPNITIPMDLKDINDVPAQWEALVKLDSKAGADSIVKVLQKEVQKISEDWSNKNKESEAAIAQAKADYEKALADIQETKAKLEKTQAELAEVKQLEVARASQEKFNERMNELDSEYDLDDEDRKVVVAELTNLSDEAYASFKSKFAVLAKEKNKKWKEANKPKEKTKAEMDEEEMKDCESKKAKAAAEALASATASTENPVITTGVQPDSNLMASYQAAFATAANGLKVTSNKRKTAK